MGKEIPSSYSPQQNTLRCVIEESSVVPGQGTSAPEIPAEQIVLHPGNSSVDHDEIESKNDGEDDRKACSQNWPARKTAYPPESESTDQSASKASQ